MEVISDDCDGLYQGQPKCSEVVARMASLGYATAGPVACRPHVRRSRQSSGCEIDVLFVAGGARVLDPRYYPYHDLKLNGCRGFYDRNELATLTSQDSLNASWRVLRVPRGSLNGGCPCYFYSSRGRNEHSFGAEYSCVKGTSVA